MFRTPLFLLACIMTTATNAQVKLEQTPQGIQVSIEGRPFTEYLTQSGAKPVLWPIHAPNGALMTRAYPLGEAPNEKKDHVHQRSLWFTHGSVNGVSFWDENKGHGSIVHRRFEKVASGKEGVLVSENEWLGPDGKKICEDVRQLTFARDGAMWRIDFDITIKATEGPVKFGDTKEGSFGIRVAETMKVEAKQGGKIVNSEGQVNEKAWGQRAAWVDYHGPVDGKTVGIAVLNHPSSFRYPTWWHVRTYGLFAANPFGIHDFDGKGDGAHTLPKGESMQLRYRVLFHAGDEKQANIAAAFEAYRKL